MAWGAEGEQLALATRDTDGARVQLWSVPKGGSPPHRIAERIYLLDDGDRFEPSLCLSEDGAQLAVVLIDRIEVLDASYALGPIKVHPIADVDRITFLLGHSRLLIASEKWDDVDRPGYWRAICPSRGRPALLLVGRTGEWAGFRGARKQPATRPLGRRCRRGVAGNGIGACTQTRGPSR